MPATKADLSRRIAALETALASLLASHRDYTESHARNKERPDSGWPALEWAKDIEWNAEQALKDLAE